MNKEFHMYSISGLLFPNKKKPEVKMNSGSRISSFSNVYSSVKKKSTTRLFVI
jgi:hypothetical protein